MNASVGRTWLIIGLVVGAIALAAAATWFMWRESISPDAGAASAAIDSTATLSDAVTSTPSPPASEPAETAETAVPPAAAAGVSSLPAPVLEINNADATPTPENPPEPTPIPEPTLTPTPTGPQDINGVPIAAIAPLSPAVAEVVREAYERGAALGRDGNAFSKLGDSTILNPHFLGPFDEGDYVLGDFAELAPTVERFAGSFARHGVAARHGLHSWTVFDPLWADKDWCEPNEDALACEFRLQNPSVLFVRLGSNDAGAPSGFRFNVRQVIEFALENGVIPVLGTKADRFEGDNTNNEIIRELAAEYNVPLWDFDLVADTLPGRGLDSDNVHLIIDELPHDYTQDGAFERGHAMQDLTALIVLDQIRQIIESRDAE